jgi:hypothetical protein
MEGTTLINSMSPRVLIVGSIAIIVVMAVLYLARWHAHRLFRDSAAFIAYLCRRLARASRHGGRVNQRRARGAVIQIAREAMERRISRQTQQLTATLARDLASFPHLHRQLHEQIRRVDEDFRNTVEAPPTPPEWIEAIETITRLPAREDPSVSRMLEDLRATLDRACHEALLAYRAASQRRHRVLKRMQPLWRRMDRGLGSLDYTMRRLQSQTQRLDEQIDAYSALVSSRGSTSRRIASSLGPRSLLSMMALTAIGLAAVVSFHLIASPLEAMAPATESLGAVPFTHVLATSILVLLGASGGVLLETVGVTRLFPEASWGNPNTRRGIALAAGLLATALVFAIAGLAWTRDYLMALGATSVTWEPGILLDNQPIFRQQGPATFQWLPALLHGLIATGLALAVATVAAPLEAFMRQARVLGLGAVSVVCYGIALIGEILASAVVQMRRILATIYDLVIILPLGIERGIVWARQPGPNRQTNRHPSGANDNRVATRRPDQAVPAADDD